MQPQACLSCTLTISLTSFPWGLFLSIGNYHITCYYRIASSNRGDKLSGFEAGWLDGSQRRVCIYVIRRNHAKCARFNRTCFPLWSEHTHTHTRNRRDTEQTAHRHRNLSLLRSIANCIRRERVCMRSTFQPKKTYFKVYAEDARAS